MAETTIVSAAKAASAQKPQQNTKATAAAANIIVRTLPPSVQPIVKEMLKKGILFPSDLEKLAGGSNGKYNPHKRKQGHPRKTLPDFPESFPEGSGIDYSNLYDERTEKIINAAVKSLRDTGLFDLDYEDMGQEIRIRLPFMLQSLKPVPGKPDTRYRYISTAVYNLVTSMIRKRRRDNGNMTFVSIEANLDEEGELSFENVVAFDDRLEKERDLAETIEELNYIFPKLDKRDQAIAFMHAYLDMSYGKIAERFGVFKNEIFYRMTVAIPARAKAIRDGLEM